MQPMERGLEMQRYVLGQAAADEQKSKTDFSGKRFLLVEDNALNREIAVEIKQFDGNNPAQQESSTTVYRLVEELNNFL